MLNVEWVTSKFSRAERKVFVDEFSYGFLSLQDACTASGYRRFRRSLLWSTKRHNRCMIGNRQDRRRINRILFVLHAVFGRNLLLNDLSFHLKDVSLLKVLYIANVIPRILIVLHHWHSLKLGSVSVLLLGRGYNSVQRSTRKAST